MAFAVQTAGETPQDLPQFHVHAGGGFVQHDDLGTMHQSLSDQHPPFHAAGEGVYVLVRLAAQVQGFQQFLHPGAVFPSEAEVPRLLFQQFMHREEGVVHQFLGHDAQGAAGLAVSTDHITAHDPHLTGVGPDQARRDVDERGFTRAVGAEQAEILALAYPEANVVQGPHIAESFADIADINGRIHISGHKKAWMNNTME